MKRTFLKVAGTVLASAMLITGCATKTGTEAKRTIYDNNELQGAPNWILAPALEGFVVEVGSASKNAGNDIAFQRAEAMANARDNLANQISVNVDNMIKSFKAATGSGANATFDKASETVSKQIASQVLNQTVVKDTWMSRSGTMYILMAIDTKRVVAQTQNAVKSSFGNDEALYQKFIAAKAQEELEKELEKRNKN